MEGTHVIDVAASVAHRFQDRAETVALARPPRLGSLYANDSVPLSFA
jgi:hypothetical protein